MESDLKGREGVAALRNLGPESVVTSLRWDSAEEHGFVAVLWFLPCLLVMASPIG